MLYPETKTPDDSFTTLMFFNGGGIGWGIYDSNFDYRIASGEYGELMQFTGLKDKNGKEIYEGDLIKAKSYSYPRFEKVIFEVKYSNISMAFMIYEHLPDLDASRLHLIDPFYNIEVIGNIYENKKLITH